MRIAVTGSTGVLGGKVAAELAAAGVHQLLLVRNPDRAPRLPGAESAVASYGDRQAAVAALQGVELLFMVSASESADRMQQHRTFIDAAAEAGVGHIVYTSFAGAGPEATFTLARDHWATEEYIRAAGPAFTFLRDNFYIDFLPDLVGADGIIRGPAGTGRVAAVARADIARAAAAVLRSPEEHAGAGYELTGPEAITLTEAAAVISAATGRPVSFHNESMTEAYASRAHYNAPQWQLDAWVSTYTAIAAGELAHRTDDVERLTGRRPLSLSQYLAAD